MQYPLRIQDTEVAERLLKMHDDLDKIKIEYQNLIYSLIAVIVVTTVDVHGLW